MIYAIIVADEEKVGVRFIEGDTEVSLVEPNSPAKRAGLDADGIGGESGDRDAAPPADDREALTRFYRRVCPHKLGNVDAILARFAGNRDAMYAMVRRIFPGEAIERPMD